MELISLISADRQSWGQLAGLINRASWEKIIILSTVPGADFPVPEHAEYLEINPDQSLLEMKKQMLSLLQGKFSGFEAHLSIASGSGKEHMALISALLSLPVGIRLVAFTKNGVEILN